MKRVLRAVVALVVALCLCASGVPSAGSAVASVAAPIASEAQGEPTAQELESDDRVEDIAGPEDGKLDGASLPATSSGAGRDETESDADAGACADDTSKERTSDESSVEKAAGDSAKGAKKTRKGTDAHPLRAESDDTAFDITPFLVSAKIFEDEVEKPWPAVVRPNREYDVRLTFEENGQALQFPDDSTPMVYALPAGMSLGENAFEREFTMDLGDGKKLAGNKVVYDPQKKTLTVTWNTEDVENFALLISSASAGFHIDFKAKFDFSTDEIVFSESTKGKIVKDTSYDVDIEKTGTYNKDTDTIDYTVTVASVGDAQNIDVWDNVEGTAITYVSDPGVAWSGEGESTITEGTFEPAPNGFSKHIDKMTDGQVITFTYSARVDYSALTGKGTEEQTKNTAYAHAVTTKSASADFEGDLDYVTVKKWHDGDSTTSEDGATMTVPWRVLFNQDCKVAVEGTTVTDSIYAGVVEAMDYKKDEDVTVYVRDKNWNTVKTLTVPWSEIETTPIQYTRNADTGLDEATGATFAWIVPSLETTGLSADSGPYMYDIRYKTVVDMTTIITGDAYIGNEVRESLTGDSMQNSVNPPGPPRPLEVEKKAVDVNADRITWEVSFARLAYDLSRVVIEDSNPKLVRDDGRTETPEPVDTETIQVRGLRGDEHWEIDSHNNTRTNIKFYKTSGTDKPGLYKDSSADSDNPDRITISFQTVNNQTWVEGTTSNPWWWYPEHTNEVRLTANGQHAQASATAKPRLMRLTKTGTQIGSLPDENGTLLPVFRFDLVLTGLADDIFDEDGNLVINDVFDTELLKLFDMTNPAQTGTDDAYLAYLSDTYLSDWVDSDGKSQRLGRYWDQKFRQEVPNWGGPVPVGVTDYQDEEGNKLGLTFTINKDAEGWDKAENGARTTAEDGTRTYGSRYKLPYYLIVKNAAAAQELAKRAAGQPANRLPFDNTATWVNANISSKATVNAQFKPVSKTMSYDSQNEVASYRIVLNPQKLKMNDGEPLKMEDAYTNLAVDFESIRVETSPASAIDDVSWSYHNNVGTYWIPDQTAVTITYQARPIGEAGKSVTFTNTASMLGTADAVEKKTTLNANFEGYAGTYSIRLFKYEDNSMNHPLEGAVFQLFESDVDGNKVPVAYAKAHESDVDEDRAIDQSKGYVWRTEGEGSDARDVPYPTTMNHAVGDPVFFTTHRNGYANIRLDMSRDGIALVRGKQYFLKEVETPAGHTAEDIYWNFIIGDMDSFDNVNHVYVYRNNGEMTVSNQSDDSGLVIRKTFVNDKTLTWAQKNAVQFRIEGPQGSGFAQTVSYEDFTKGRFKIPPAKLVPGTWTVTELGADMPTHKRTTTVETKTVVEGEEPVVATSEFVQDVTAESSESPSVSVDVTQDEINASAVKSVAFTNAYQPLNLDLTISKNWGDRARGQLADLEATMVLYRDGTPYKRNAGEGEEPQVVRLELDEANEWRQVVNDVPRYNDDGTEIAWSVGEFEVRFKQDGSQVTIPEEDIPLRFGVTAVGASGEELEVSGARATLEPSADGKTESVAFTNELLETKQVKIKKRWDDVDDAHTDDQILFDLYRTTKKISQGGARPEKKVGLIKENGQAFDYAPDEITIHPGDEIQFKVVSRQRNVKGPTRINPDTGEPEIKNSVKNPSTGENVEAYRPARFPPDSEKAEYYNEFTEQWVKIEGYYRWCINFPGVSINNSTGIEVPDGYDLTNGNAGHFLPLVSVVNGAGDPITRNSSNYAVNNYWLADTEASKVAVVTVRIPEAEEYFDMIDKLLIRLWTDADVTVTNLSDSGDSSLQYARSDFEEHVAAGKAELVKSGVKLTSDTTADEVWTYVKDLPKADADGNEYTYFAIERVPAGYEDSYAVDADGTVSITNRKGDLDPGVLKVTKKVVGLPTGRYTDKSYSIRVSNSGKYVVDSSTGELLTAKQASDQNKPTVFTLTAGETLEFTNLAPGLYEIEELGTDQGVASGAWISGYELVVTGAEGYVVPSNGTVQATITNSYVSETTGFTFGKVWTDPEGKSADPAAWPEGREIVVDVQRKVKGTEQTDPNFKLVLHMDDTGGVALDDKSLTADAAALTFEAGEPSATKLYTYEIDGLPANVLEGEDTGKKWVYYATEEAGDGEYDAYYGWVDGTVIRPQQTWTSAEGSTATTRYIINVKHVAIELPDLPTTGAFLFMTFVGCLLLAGGLALMYGHLRRREE